MSLALDLHENAGKRVLSVLSREGRKIRNTNAAVNRALTSSIVGRDEVCFRMQARAQRFPACIHRMQVLKFLSPQPDLRVPLSESDPVMIEYDVAFPVVVSVFGLYGHSLELDTHVIVHPIQEGVRVEPGHSHFLSFRFPRDSLTKLYGVMFRVELTEENSRSVVAKNDSQLTGRRVLYEHFMPLRLYLVSEAELHFESRDEEACHFLLTAPSNCNWGLASGCQQKYEREITFLLPASANLFALFMLLDVWEIARMNKRLFTSIFDVLFESVSVDVSREAAVNATLEQCSLLLRLVQAHGPRDFALGIDCLVFVPPLESQPSYLSSECSHHGKFLCGLEDRLENCDCYCDTWTWGRSCEFNWDTQV